MIMMIMMLQKTSGGGGVVRVGVVRVFEEICTEAKH
jgi:hypothetical protein